jgi:CRP-like cAMP-binding protein
VAELGFDPVARRVVRLLLGVGTDTVGLTHEQLAQRVASTRESVTKALGWLTRERVVEQRRGEIRILDRRRLVEILGP